MSAILPGATLGLLGGGQLGRLTAMAARTLGYGVAVLIPDPGCAGGAVADRRITAAFDDVDAAAELARGAHVVTYEIERIGIAAAQRAATLAPVRPGPHVLELVQDRAKQKSWLAGHGFPVGPWRPAASRDEAVAAARALGGACRIKSATGGYDGRGQARAIDPSAAAAAHEAVGGGAVVVERELALATELSVLVARRPSGETSVFPVAQNWHENGILVVSCLPVDVPAALAAQAVDLGRSIADALGLEGLLCIELFHTGAADLLVNELAPRPHNTFHASETACATSEFEQLVRAVCDLPLHLTQLVRPTALVNLLGDLWLGPHPPDLPRLLAMPGLRLHLYGKAPRPARKVGHLLLPAATPAQALAAAESVRAALARG